MQTCQRCGGARFYGSGAVGWGGPLCSCAYPQVPNPDIPAYFCQPPVPSPIPRIAELEQRVEVLEKLPAPKGAPNAK